MQPLHHQVKGRGTVGRRDDMCLIVQGGGVFVRFQRRLGGIDGAPAIVLVQAQAAQQTVGGPASLATERDLRARHFPRPVRRPGRPDGHHSGRHAGRHWRPAMGTGCHQGTRIRLASW